MDIKSLEIKTKTNRNWDDIVYINDFNVNSSEIIKRESRIGASIYYIGYVLEPNYDYNTINPFYFVINRLTCYIEEIEGSSDKYLVVAKNVRNKNIISALDMVWGSIENKPNYHSLCSTCVTYRTPCHAIGHQVLPTQPLPREAEDFPRGDKYFKHVPPFTYLIYFSPKGYT